MHHIVFYCRIPVVLESRWSSQRAGGGGGGGGGGVHIPAPPRSAPVYLHGYIFFEHNLA